MNTNTTNQPSKVLPSGLSVQISQIWKIYSWKHTQTIGEGDASLNGLLKVKPPESTLPKLIHPKMKGIGDPTPEQAKAISQNYSNLPAILISLGFEVLDDKREAFIQRATQAKAQLARIYVGKSIPIEEINRYDDAVNTLQFQGVEVVVRGFLVSSENSKGARRRRSDGQFVSERVLRRVTIDKPLAESQMLLLLEQISGPVIQSMARAAEYTVITKGCDVYGNPNVSIIPTSAVNSVKVRQSKMNLEETNVFG